MSFVSGRFTSAGRSCHSENGVSDDTRGPLDERGRTFGLIGVVDAIAKAPSYALVAIDKPAQQSVPVLAEIASQLGKTYRSGGAAGWSFRCAVLTSESTDAKEVDCPPTTPQYCCCVSAFPPTTTVFAPSSLAIVTCPTVSASNLDEVQRDHSRRITSTNSRSARWIRWRPSSDQTAPPRARCPRSPQAGTRFRASG